MKNLLYLLIIALLFSCAPKKIITATKTEQSTNVQNAIVDTNNSQNKEVKTKVEQSDTGTETVTKTTVYDQKKDSLTGKQLIKSETVTTKKKTEKKAIKTDSNNAGSQTITHVDSSKSAVQIKSDIEIKEIPKAPAIKYWLYLIGFMVGILLVLRYWTTIKSFLGFK